MLSNCFVRDVMVRGIVEVDLNDKLSDVVKVMAENDVSSVVVSDDNGYFWGIITELDVLKNHGDLDKITAEEIMTTKPITVKPITPLEQAAEIMVENKIHHLYVLSELNENKIVGVISAGDIIKAINKKING